MKYASKLTKCSIVSLEAGDFANSNRKVVIERKTPMDVWGRIYNKTWHKQLQKLQTYCLSNGVIPWLIVEGSFYDAHTKSKGKVPILECQQAVYSATVRYGLAVWHTNTLRESVDVAVGICKHADEGKLANPKKIPYMKHVGDSRVGVVMNLFRVSRRQAISLLESERSIIGILRALKHSPNKLQRLDFIGPGTVKRMKKLMYSEFK